MTQAMEKLLKDATTGTTLLLCPAALGARVCLRIVKPYSHMGKKMVANGSQLAELMSRHTSAVPYVHRLTWHFQKSQGKR